jgi:hypothetical protein
LNKSSYLSATHFPMVQFTGRVRHNLDMLTDCWLGTACAVPPEERQAPFL